MDLFNLSKLKLASHNLVPSEGHKTLANQVTDGLGCFTASIVYSVCGLPIPCYLHV